jgi:hypothetical protein
MDNFTLFGLFSDALCNSQYIASTDRMNENA